MVVPDTDPAHQHHTGRPKLSNGKTDVLVAEPGGRQRDGPGPGSPHREFATVQTLQSNTRKASFPGAVQWARLEENSPYYDAIVVGSGSNDILVYRCTGFDAAGNPTFAGPQGYFVGTDPVSVTIDDINGDGEPADIFIADKGSNNIATLFGSWDTNGYWQGTSGPREVSSGAEQD